MRILRMIYEWPPPWQGLAPAPYEMTKAQLKLGHEFDVFCARWPKAGPIEELEKVKLFTVWRAPLEGTVGITSAIILFFKYLIFRMKNPSDIIHAHGHFGVWVYAYRRFLQKYFPWVKEVMTPMVVHFHNTVKGRQVKLEENEANIKTISKYLDWPLAQLADTLAIKTADAYIFVSEDLKKEAIQYYKADPQKCFVVESGVNAEAFTAISPEEKAKTRIELNLEPADKIILYVGVLTERKNIHLLIQALEFLPKNYKLMLMGSGPEDYMDKLNAIIADKKLSDRVIKVGYTPYPDIPIAYQSADLFVIPSTFEGLPKAAIEALSCGLPVLASGFSLKEEVKGIEYLANLNVSDIAGKIKDMIQSPREVDTYTIRRDYSWVVKAQQVERVYEYVKTTFLK